MAKKKTSVGAFIVAIVLLIVASFLPPEVRQAIESLTGLDLGGGGYHQDTVSEGDLPSVAGSYNTAKKYLYEDIFYDHRVTVYCGCEYDKDKNVDLKSCGMTALSGVTRALSVEAEHAMPASYMGEDRRCWQEAICTDSDGEPFKGRECCEESDPVFRAAHADLYNLFPSVGEINGDRSNTPYGEVSGEAREYGDCDFEVGGGAAEPAPGVRGDVARAWLYMEATYGIPIDSGHRAMLEKWSREDPPDSWEKTRSERIRKIQGRGNPFIDG
jgi:deoxyribonuclease-1